MIVILRVAYIILMAYLVFRMFKNGGCCGHGNQSNKKDHCHNSQDIKQNSHSTFITEEEKRNAIDL